jgi:type VI secretion system protein VasG
MLDDAEGREIDFRNTLIILTSNVGLAADHAGLQPADEPAAGALAEALRPCCSRHLQAGLPRPHWQVVPFYPIATRCCADHRAQARPHPRADRRPTTRPAFSWDPRWSTPSLARCTEVDSGARNVDHILTGTLLPEIAEAVLARMAEGEAVQRVRVTAGRKGDFKYAIK